MQRDPNLDKSLDDGWYIDGIESAAARRAESSAQDDKPTCQHSQVRRRRTIPLPTKQQLSKSRTRTSVDTIHLIGRFEIVEQLSSDFVILRFYQQGDKTRWYTEHDVSYPLSFTDRKARANKGGMNVLIEPLYPGSREVVCKVAFSAPKVLYGTNEQVISAEECERAFARVEELLLQMGLKMNVREATLVQVDVLRHLEMNRPATCHVKLLHYLTITHSEKTINYPTSIVRGNESVQLMIYDKRAEMEKKKCLPSQIVPISVDHQKLLEKLEAGTILRIEWRLRNAAVVRRELNVSTVHEFLLMFKSLDSWLTRKLRVNLFREKVPYDVQSLIGQPPLDRPTVRQRSQYLAKALGGTSRAVRQTLMFEALEQTMQAHPSNYMEIVRDLHTCCRDSGGCSKSQTHFRKIMLLGLSVEGIPNAVLYEELRRAATTRPGVDWTQPRQTPGTARRRR